MQNIKKDSPNFEYFFNLSPEMMCILDFKGNVVKINHAFEQGLGYTKEELQEKPLFDLLHPNDRNGTMTGLYMQQLGYYEYRFFCSDGRYKWLSWSVVPMVEEEQIIAVVRDISSNKSRESKDFQANKITNNALENIPDAIFVLNAEGSITYLNNKAEELTARPKKEITGKRIWDVIPQTINTFLYKEYRKIISEGIPYNLEAFHPTRNQWFEVRTHPFEEGMVVYYYDITQRKLTEGALRLKEKAFDYNSSLMAVVSYPDLIILDVNESFLNLLGFYREEVVGKTLAELGIGADEEERIGQVRDILCKNGIVRNIELHYKTKSGEERTGLLSVDSFAIGEKQYFLGTLNDITDKIKAETGIERVEQLNLAARMVTGIAHEIRNPITTIFGLLQILIMKEELNKYKEYVDMIISETYRINSVIDDFLSFGRKTVENYKTQQLDVIIKDLYPLIYAYALELGHEITMDLNYVPELLLEDNEVRQLVINLVRNGLEAMNKKGRISIRTYMMEDDAILSVSDEGGEIDRSVLESMGTPFFTTKMKGTGLGLAKCFNIAHKHGAEIKIENCKTGTTVFVCFNISKNYGLSGSKG